MTDRSDLDLINDIHRRLNPIAVTDKQLGSLAHATLTPAEEERPREQMTRIESLKSIDTGYVPR